MESLSWGSCLVINDRLNMEIDVPKKRRDGAEGGIATTSCNDTPKTLEDFPATQSRASDLSKTAIPRLPAAL